MFQKLQELEDKFVQLENRLSDPSLAEDQKKFRDVSKERADLEELVTQFRHYKELERSNQDSREMMENESDEEMRAMAKEEYEQTSKQIVCLKEELKLLLLPKDPMDEKNVILEIRAGAGGDEAGLFANELFRMYLKFCEKHRWKVSIMSINEASPGNIREITATIEGERVYSTLKWESGVHRVQRVPQTESGGRIHTSTVTCAVLPEVDDIEIEVRPEDLRIDTFRASGAGGQHVNTTDSAVRITHMPSGIVVGCQDERSQHKNRDKAMKALRAKLYEVAQREQTEALTSDRKSQVGTGDRSEKIRTYNFPQNRVTDHRINETTHNLSSFMEGNIDEMISKLSAAAQLELLKSSGLDSGV